MLNILIVRKQTSLSYQRVPPADDLWHTNDFNNSLDQFFVKDDDKTLFICPVQSVSNMEGLDPTVHFYDTIAPGNFFIKSFRAQQYPTQHYGRIHGVVRATTLNGDLINDDSVTDKNKSPWLVHDWQKTKGNNAVGQDTRVAWSAGCLVVTDYGLDKTGQIFDSYGVKPGDLIAVKLIME